HYTGELRVLTTPGPLVVASAPFSGSGAAADARLDLAEVDWRHLGAAFGVDLQIEGGGELTVTTEPFDASLSVDLTGHFAENAVSLRGSAPDDLRLSLGGPAGHLTGSLAWSDS